MVVMRDVNEDEIYDMVDFCLEHNFTLRFIETMPVGSTGRSATARYVDLAEVRQKLSARYELVPGVMPGGGPARYVQIGGTELRIGFITPMSQHFCDTCNRVRLSVDGTLYTCLGQDHSYPLRELVRNGCDIDTLMQHIQRAITKKPERHEFTEQPDKIIRFMSYTGG